MVRFGKGVNPVDELFQVSRRALGQLRRLDAQRMGQSEQLSGRAAPGRRLLARDDLRPITVKHRSPTRSLLMRQPIDFLGIEGGQSACNSLPPQIVLFGMV